jgi:hypothetical protein
MAELVYDVESYRNVFLFGARRLSDGKTVILEESERSTIDRDHLRRIMLGNTMIGYNSTGYDSVVTWLFINGASVSEVKDATNQIIIGGLRPWEGERALKVEIPWAFKERHIDLIEPQPNPFASLKVLHARLGGKELRDLPYDPEKILTYDEIDQLRIYLERSDLPATEKLWHAMAEGMDLRRTVGASIGQNVLSKSDTQMGLAIIKKRCEELLGHSIDRNQMQPEPFFYTPPDYIKFEDPVLRELLQRIKGHRFLVGADGKVDLPDWLSDTPIRIGETTYSMGIGGLHSTESNRAIKSSGTHVLVDFDVASYYPAIIINSGLYPKAVGTTFLKVYQGIREDRLKAKKKAKAIKKEIAELEGGVGPCGFGEIPMGEIDDIKARLSTLKAHLAECEAQDKSFKVSLNGCFGSLGSKFSFVYAPHLLIAVTITGQLALLMLIERAHRAGIPAVSGNTDGVVFRCPRGLWDGLDGNRPRPSVLADVIISWERDTGFDLEGTEYAALYSQSVNSYFAIKPGGGHKRKGPNANPWSEDPNDKDARGALTKNPQMTICTDAALARIKYGTPLRETIEACSDVLQFVTVIKATAGATWRGKYLGKVIRYYWSTDGAEILEAKPNPKTGHFKKVPKTEGAAELMTLPDQLPDDIDYDRYVAEAETILKELGFYGEVLPPEKRIWLTKANKIKVLKTWMVAA